MVRKDESVFFVLKPSGISLARIHGPGAHTAGLCLRPIAVEIADAFWSSKPALRVAEEVRILHDFSITATQILESLLAIPAFLPATLCTGYLVAWFTNLLGFRQRSLVERLFWSVPLSIGISTIAAVLIAWFLSLTAVVVFFLAGGLLWLGVLVREWLEVRSVGGKLAIGWQPLGGKALLLALIWIAVVIVSLVDFQSGHQLFMNIATYDHASRVSWTETIVRTGVPPANPLYWYKHAAALRYYYFWNVVCAAVAQMAHLPVRAVFIASCIWAGFALAALTGLYLKHFLAAGVRLRRQFLLCISLLVVTGLDICVNLWNLFYLSRPLPDDLEWWSKSQVTSWLDSLLWAPHHVASLVCCMFAFLLAWADGSNGKRRPVVTVVFIAAALASAFGLSVYVAFGFFLVMLFWAPWQIVVERKFRSALLLAAGGAGAAVLLIPYLRELAHGASSGGTQGGSGSTSVFTFAIREMFPPEGLLATHLFQNIALAHPSAARNIANLVLLAPGYMIELGFYLAVLLIYLVPAWRGRKPLTPAQRSLAVIATVALLVISVLRSSVLNSNDFGWRAALLLQFPLLLFGSEVMTSWKLAERKSITPADAAGLPQQTPQWLRSIAALALVIGVMSTVCQALVLRFDTPLNEARLRAIHDPDAGKLPHNAYISAIGYAKLDPVIPHDAIVQFNPSVQPYIWTADLLGNDHQTAILTDKPECGAELGGDPSGCLPMAAAIDSLYIGASAEQARATCREFGIQFLVTRIYDAAWKDKSSWVWTLRPVVSDDEFRVLACQPADSQLSIAVLDGER
jgi:hypothetical protein